jgi:hypothetical protein
VNAHSPRINPLVATPEHAPLLRQDSPTHALQLATNDHSMPLFGCACVL